MISIIIPVKNRLKHLKKCLSYAVLLRGDYEIIVVDMNCPEGSSDYVDALKYSNVKAVKMDVAENHWNLSECRNYGYKQSSGDYLLFIDADTLLESDFLREAKKVGNESFATGQKDLPLLVSGCAMITTRHFERVKGYNEALKGWGFEDLDLYERLISLGLERKEFDLRLIRNMVHPDEQRNQYHGDSPVSVTNECNHQIAKRKFKGL